MISYRDDLAKEMVMMIEGPLGIKPFDVCDVLLPLVRSFRSDLQPMKRLTFIFHLDL